MMIMNFWGIKDDAARIESYRYGGEEYEEATCGRGGYKALILPLLLSSVEFMFFNANYHE